MANAAYTASNAEVSLRLVGTMQVSGYSETGKTYDDLLNDVTSGTGVMSGVHAQRDTLGADLVALFVNHTQYCGLAWVDSTATYAYSTITYSCVNGHTFAHELGHNFGALHDVANSGGGTPPYLYGYGYVHPQNLWRTIQSYNVCNCARIGHFSNPDVSYQGDVTGTAATHNVARVHRERKDTVAAFRAATQGTKAVMSSPAQGATLAGATATFQWNAGSGAQAYWLYVGSSVGGSQYHDSGNISAGTLSRQVTSLPTNGSTVHVRLFTQLAGAWQYNDYTYTAATGTAKAVMSSPTPGSALGSSATFGWTTGSGVAEYWLTVGSTGAGSTNIYNASTGTSTSKAVSGLPSSGTIHVRLWSKIGGAWQYNDYTYATASKAVMTSPAPGSALGSSATFGWTTGSGVAEYWLTVGSTGAGSTNVYNASTGTSTSKAVSGLPSSGTIYVRLWSKIGGSWQYNDYTYTAASSGTKAVMSSPAQGSTIGSPTTFHWTTGTNVSQYWLYVGSTGVGSSNLYNQNTGTATSRSVAGIPASGTVYVRLYSLIGGSWVYNDYTYTGSGKAIMTSPLQGALVSSTMTFTWTTGSGVTQYWLYVGTTGAGSRNVFNASDGTSNTITVGGLPSTGTVYVRLWSLISGTWVYNDYTYTATPRAVMTSPAPGSALATSAVFKWTLGTGATQYWLYVGSTGVGSANLFNASDGTSNTITVGGLPSTGTVYVRLWSLISGTWQYVDYTYGTGAAKAAMISPAPGSTLGSSAPFTWSAGHGASEYWLYVGTTGTGSYDLVNQSTGTATSKTVSGLPSSGTVYVRLWSYLSNGWTYTDYSYNAGTDAFGPAAAIGEDVREVSLR